MTPEEIRELIAEANPEALMADGFEDALVGVAEQFTRIMACYDYDKCIEILCKRDGMSEDEAVEYFDFNVAGASMGEFTPVFIKDFRNIKGEE
jgi:hypothetical protein